MRGQVHSNLSLESAVFWNKDALKFALITRVGNGTSFLLDVGILSTITVFITTRPMHQRHQPIEELLLWSSSLLLIIFVHTGLVYIAIVLRMLGIIMSLKK